LREKKTDTTNIDTYKSGKNRAAKQRPKPTGEAESSSSGAPTKQTQVRKKTTRERGRRERREKREEGKEKAEPLFDPRH
jgi:hypothetical protein